MDIFNVNKKKCTYCGEEIDANAARCAHCGSLLDVVSDAFKAESGMSVSEPEQVIQEEFVNTQTGDIYTDSQENRPLSNIIDTESNATGPNIGIPENVNSQNAFNPQPANFQGPVKVPAKTSLSNGMKVFLTTICTVVPLLGQIAGLILSIVFMNNQEDEDKRSFGLALLVVSLIFFFLSCISCFVVIIAVTAAQRSGFY